MASDEELGARTAAKGFAGLSAMVSDVDTVIRETNEERPGPWASRVSVPGARQDPQHDTGERRESGQPSPPAPSQRRPSLGKWILGFFGVVFVLIWLRSETGNRATSPAPTNYTGARPPVTAVPDSTSQRLPPPTPTQAPSRPVEEKPPVGRNNVLTAAQIRYCLAEQIRIEAAEAVVNSYSQADVYRFNAMVDDYNGRCGEFRYRQGSLDTARTEVERYRSTLQSEGLSRFKQIPSASTSQSPPENVRPQPDTLVLAIQKRLNELGYSPGPADGVAGARTRTAIIQFQRDRDIPADGVATPGLLQRLNSASKKD